MRFYQASNGEPEEGAIYLGEHGDKGEPGYPHVQAGTRKPIKSPRWESARSSIANRLNREEARKSRRSKRFSG